MFGLVTFAELIFADMGGSTHIETGWIKECKDPCADEAWMKQPKNDVPTKPCDKGTNNWTLIK